MMFEARIYFRTGTVMNVKMRHPKERIGIYTLAETQPKAEYYVYATDEVEDGLPVYRPRDE
jgi:hypothetical protein